MSIPVKLVVHYFFTEFTDASMPPQTMLAWVSTGFRLLSQLTNFKLYSFRFKFRRQVFLESFNSTASNAMQLAGSKFQSWITLFVNAYFLTFSLNLFLNSFWSCPLLSPSSSWKNNSGLISYFLLTILKVSIRSLLIPTFESTHFSCFRTWKTPCVEINRKSFTGVRMRKPTHVFCFQK